MTALGHFCPQFDDQIKEKGSGFYAGLGQDEFFKGTVAQDWPMLTLLNSTAQCSPAHLIDYFGHIGPIILIDMDICTF